MSNADFTCATNTHTVGVNCPSQLGGPIQGASLSMSKAVSTFAGIAGIYVDGTGEAAKFAYPHASVSDGTNLYVHR